MVRFIFFVCMVMFCTIDGYSQLPEFQEHELGIAHGKKNRYRVAADYYSLYIRNINNTIEGNIDCLFYKGGYCGYVPEWPDRRKDIQEIVNTVLQPYKDMINNSRYKGICITFYLPITGGRIKDISFVYIKELVIPITVIEKLEKELKEKITFHIEFDATSKTKPLRDYTNIAIEASYSVM